MAAIAQWLQPDIKEMRHSIRITRGCDLPIAGRVEEADTISSITPKACAVVPDDFHGFVPKADVKPGDRVKIGTPLLHDKRDPEIKIVSPCCGTVTAVERGERRHIEKIAVVPDNEPSEVDSKAVLPSYADECYEILPSVTETSSGDDIRKFLKNSGLWAMMRQRPYDIVPNPDIEIRDIFVTSFDSAPLAVDAATIDAETAAIAVKALARLTDGKVYISRRNAEQCPDIAGAQMVDIAGPHPAGNAGTVIANVAPVNKGEAVVTLDMPTLLRIGTAIKARRLNPFTTIAVTGSEVERPELVVTLIGADLKSIIGGNLKPEKKHIRIISGNVLTGVRCQEDGFIRFPYRQITVIPEGDDVDEFMGWATLSLKKLSRSRSFTSRLFPFLAPKRFNPDARLLGGRRALIMSGEYERYMPFDIMPEFLLKAIIGRDIEKMEQLGIYEVAPEDFALGEFADTSKLEAQRIVREGLDYLRKELD